MITSSYVYILYKCKVKHRGILWVLVFDVFFCYGFWYLVAGG